MSKDDYARAIIAAGQKKAVTPRGIVIALATTLVESNLTMYANAKVPESLALPHEAVGSDGMSVGLFQQQVRKGATGQWWWGDAATCMDPALSASLFYDRLLRLDYNGRNSPGSYAQAVQQSAFPDRYDQRMADAQKIYDRLATGAQPVTDPNRPAFNEFPLWSPSSSGRGGTKIDAVFLHTQEGGGGDSAAEDLAKFLGNAANQVSYHYSVGQASDGGVTVVDVVDTDEMSWSVLSANSRSINLCFAGSKASWTTAQWMQQSKAIDVAAYLIVQDCKKYGIPTKVVAPPYADRIPGISDHAYVTKVLGDGTHTDVGPNFPWPYFQQRITFWTAGGTVTTPAVPTPAPIKKFPDDWTDRELLVELLRQLRGPTLSGWPQLGNKSVVDYLASKDAS